MDNSCERKWNAINYYLKIDIRVLNRGSNQSKWVEENRNLIVNSDKRGSIKSIVNDWIVWQVMRKDLFCAKVCCPVKGMKMHSV